MSRKQTYQYSVVRYSHDPAAGEALNIGVVLYCASAGFLEARLNGRFKRLSEAFAAFDGDQYRTTVTRIERVFERRAERLRTDVLQLEEPPRDAEREVSRDLEQIVADLWPDQELSYQFGPTLCGVTDALHEALDTLYDRFVLSQYEQVQRVKRDDKEVWAVYQDVLRSEKVSPHLQEKTFPVDGFDYKFDYAFKNGTWQALQPVSMDYAEKRGIRDRVDKLLGEAQVLGHRQALGKLYLLLGKPSDSEHMPSYRSALKLLNTMELEHEIVEEDQAESFGKRLARQMREYGIIGE